LGIGTVRDNHITLESYAVALLVYRK